MNRKNFKNLKYLWFSILLMLLDIGSKYWIKTHFFIGEVFSIFSFCNFCYIHNAGLAFGLFSSINESYRWFFIWVIVPVILVFIFYLYKSIEYNIRYYYFAYSMLVGGALGNLFDRFVYGTVIDFIDIHINNWHWPIFNIADLEIFIGIIMLIMRRNFFL